MSKQELEEILVEGPAPLVERGFGEAEDLGRIESGGKLSGADPGAVSARAYERGCRSSGPWAPATTSSRSSTWTRSTTRKPLKRSACVRGGSRS